MFYIAAMPRTKTAWLATLFTAAGTRTAHEPISREIDIALERPEVSFAKLKFSYDGIVDSSVCWFPDYALEDTKDRVAVIDTLPSVTMESLRRRGLDSENESKILKKIRDKMVRLMDRDWVISVDYERLYPAGIPDYEGINRLYNMLTDKELDRRLFQDFKHMNIQRQDSEEVFGHIRSMR